MLFQARLAFCKFMVKPSTLLVLDEPTNHLDIPSKEMLEVCSLVPFAFVPLFIYSPLTQDLLLTRAFVDLSIC